MYKKIIMSLGVIAVVAGLSYGATGAFFSDSETSTGNTFTAGAIDLKVDSQQHYAGLICSNVGNQEVPNYAWVLENQQVPTTRPDLVGQPCSGTWTMKDLVPGVDKFFNFDDVKPGDMGENTISLHIDNNPAYACADLSNVVNAENTHLQPEINSGDATAGPATNGELGANLDFLVWNDNGVGLEGQVAGNNIWDANEVGQDTTGGAPSANATYTLADSSGPAISPAGTSYLGIAWCAGTFTAGSAGVTPVCDGSSMDNKSQTDSYTADIGIRVVQSRNNDQFICTPPVEDPNEINQSDLATILSEVVNNPTKWFFYNDTNPEGIMTIDQFSGSGGQNHMELVAGEEGAKMVLGTEANPRYNIATAQFGGTLLNTISPLNFRVYDATVDGDTPFLQFNVDFATSTVGAGYQGRLTMQPGTSTNAPLASATWTTVDAINGGNAMWTWSKFAVGPDLIATTGDDNSWPDGNTNQYRSWNSIITSIPTAKLLTPGTFFGVRTGQPGPAGATNFVSSINFNGTVYNFEN